MWYKKQLVTFGARLFHSWLNPFTFLKQCATAVSALGVHLVYYWESKAVSLQNSETIATVRSLYNGSPYTCEMASLFCNSRLLVHFAGTNSVHYRRQPFHCRADSNIENGQQPQGIRGIEQQALD